MRTCRVCLGLLLQAGCGDTSPPSFELVRVTPATIPSGVATRAIVEGKEFYNALNVRLDDSRPTTINRGWDVRVDTIELQREETLRVDTNTLSILLPASLPLGVHSLSVTDPRGQTRSLAKALTVTADSNTTAPNDIGGATSVGSGGFPSQTDGGKSDTLPVTGGVATAGGGTGSLASGGVSAIGGGADAAGGTGAGTESTSVPAATCNDAILNGDETGLDCGGAVCPACPCQRAVFLTPTRIVFSDRANIATSATFWSPTLSADGLTLIFAAVVNGSARLYRTTRTSTSATTFAGTQELFADAPEIRGTPSLSFDGLTLYFDSSGLGSLGGRDLFAVTRATVDSPFGAPKAMTAINTKAIEHLAFATRDELTLYYLSEATSGDGDIWRAKRSSRQVAFGAGSAVKELNSAASEGRLTLTSDAAVAYFSSDRARASDYDIWTAVRSANETFGAPTRVPSLSTNSQETDIFLTRDNAEMFFVSDRDGSSYIYRALRQCN